MRVIVSAFFLLFAQSTNAASTCDINAIVQHAWPEAKPAAEGKMLTKSNQVIDITGNSAQSVICRVWPAHPELTLAAIPLMAQQDNDYDHTGDLELLVLDSASLDVKQRLRLPERMNDDAIRISGLILDTARWKVATNQTAFGLRIARTGSSRVNPFSEDVLSLFVIENHQLRTILNGIVLENSTGEWDGNCEGTFNDITRTLSLTPDSHNGYVDIRVSEKSVASNANLQANAECTSKDKSSKASWTLLYNGKQYVVPKNLAPLE